jgi:type 1 fimbria pilin
MKKLMFTLWLVVITFSGVVLHTMAQGVIEFRGRIVEPTCALQVGDASLTRRSPPAQGRLISVDGVTLRLSYDLSDPACGKAAALNMQVIALTDGTQARAMQPTGVTLLVSIP